MTVKTIRWTSRIWWPNWMRVTTWSAAGVRTGATLSSGASSLRGWATASFARSPESTCAILVAPSKPTARK
ncbi:MAG: hypothetical protein MZV64_34620 [Ignavibacteriales bacterium]|nr:hypothetical protein [Ignavibacteriales bacterium]